MLLRTATAALVLATVAVLASPAGAAIVHVDVTNESGVEDGSAANPFNTIQEGIDAALSGDRVQVAPGRYKETILMRDGVSVLGSGADRTIIDGTGMSNSVVSFNGTRLSPVFSDFTVTGGKGDQVGDIGGNPIRVGGGIQILQSSPAILRNIIRNNVIDQGYALGGGIYVDTILAAPLIRDNVIADNAALSATVPGSGEGGGIYVSAKSATISIRGNHILRNRAVKGGGIQIQNLSDSTARIERNVIRDNEAILGGGIWSRDEVGSLTESLNNLIAGNGGADPLARGGGHYAEAVGTGMFRMVNNTLAHNLADGGSGGAIWLDDSLSGGTSLVANNVLAYNGAATGGGADHTLFLGELRSNQFFGNPGGDLYDAGGSGATLVDNQFTDPQLRDPLQGNYELGPTSPCIDTGDDVAAPATDLHGFPRPFDGEASGVAQSDRGAYEYPAAGVDALTLPDAGTVAWSVLPQQAGFHLYRGSLSRLASTGEFTQDPATEPLADRFCGLLPGDQPWSDPFLPPAGEGTFYLLTLTDGGWEGPLGESTDGYPRPNLNPCP